MNHNGHADEGHCFAFARNNRVGPELEWFFFDDDDVREVRNTDLIVTKHAYILFYAKMSTEDYWR